MKKKRKQKLIKEITNAIYTDVSNDAKNLQLRQQNPADGSPNSPYNDGGTYSPGNPLTPHNNGKPPWQYQFMVGNNIVITPRAEDRRLLPFAVLRDIACNHDLTALCIQMMIDQVRGDEWDIVPADKNDRTDRTSEIEEAKERWRKPDGVHLYNDWLTMLLHDGLGTDTSCIYKRFTRGGELYSLEVVDGTTIKPLIDIYGRVPQPPYAAYQQIIYGYPYGSSDKSYKSLGFTSKEISYRPRYPRTWTPYGFSPIEKIILKINIDLRRNARNLKFYTDGSTPDGGIYVFDRPDITPDEIEQFATLYNDIMSGDLRERWKLKFLPKGQYIKTKEYDFDVKFDEWLARIVAISFGVNPQAFIMMMNRSTGQLQDQQQTDIGLDPLETFLAEWFTDITQHDMGFKHLKFRYVDEKREDAKVSIQRDKEFVETGIMTIDEVRSKRGMPPLTGYKGGIPAIIKVGNDIIPLTQEYLEAKTKAQLEALKMGNVQDGNQQNTEVRLKQAENAHLREKNVTDEEVVADDKKDARKAVQNELKQFEKFAINRLKKKSKREFEPKVLSKEMTNAISDKLQNADKAQVQKVFANLYTMNATSYAMADAEQALDVAFEELEDEILENADSVEDTDSKKKLILLLFANIDFSMFDEPFKDMLYDYADITARQAVREIESIGGEIDDITLKRVIEDAVAERHTFLMDDIKRVTEDKIASDTFNIETGLPLTEAIIDSYALSPDRSKAFAETEQRRMENYVRIAVAKESEEVAGVLVSDGMEFDEPCINANGQVWSLEFAGEHLLEHPRCIRGFTYLTAEEVKAHGGIDEE